MSKVTVLDFAGTYGPPGRMFTRDMTAAELAQRDLDIADGIEQDRKRRAILTAAQFREKFTPLERKDVRKSPDDEVQEGREIIFTEPVVNLLSDRAQHYVRNILGVKGKGADGLTPILTPARVEEVLTIPAA